MKLRSLYQIETEVKDCSCSEFDYLPKNKNRSILSSLEIRPNIHITMAIFIIVLGDLGVPFKLRINVHGTGKMGS